MRRATAVTGRLQRVSVIAVILAAGAQPAAAQTETVERLSGLIGRWTGALTYLDYGDDETRFTLPTTLECMAQASGGGYWLRFSYTEPSGEVVTGQSAIRVADEEGQIRFDGLWQIVDEHVSPSGVVRLVLERRGTDNDRASLIRQTIELGETELVLKKEVRYHGTERTLVRNEYRLERVGPLDR